MLVRRVAYGKQRIPRYRVDTLAAITANDRVRGPTGGWGMGNKQDDNQKGGERRNLPDRRRSNDRRGALRWDPKQKERRSGGDRRREQKTLGWGWAYV